MNVYNMSISASTISLGSTSFSQASIQTTPTPPLTSIHGHQHAVIEPGRP